MNDNPAPIEVDVSGVYGNPVTDAGIPASVIDAARDTALLIGVDIVEHFHAALQEVGVRKITFKSVAMDDDHVMGLRSFGDIDARFDYIIGFEGDYPVGANQQESRVRLNNLMMRDLWRPFIKDGVGSYDEGVPNRLTDMQGTCSSPYMPQSKYPVIYIRLGATHLG